MKQLRAEVGEFLVARVIVEAQRVFASVPEAKKHWPTREDMALAYLHSFKMLASLARADGIDSSPTIKSRLRDAMAGEYFSRIMEQRLKDLKFTDKEVEDFYKANTRRFHRAGSFRIRKIFLNVFDSPGKAGDKESLARKALAELKAGKPFKEVAEKYSDDEVDKGEVLRPLPLGEISPDLEKAILALKPGQFTDIIPTKWGFNIFQLESVQLPTTRTLESAREEIVEELRADKEPDVRLKLRAELGQKFPVAKNYEVIDDPKTTDGAVLVQAKFVTITAGEFRQYIQSLPRKLQAEANLPESRSGYLDDRAIAAQIEQAAIESGMANAPDTQAIQRYVREAVLAWSYLDPVLDRMPAPTEQDMRKFYDDNIEIFTRPVEVRLRELVLGAAYPENSAPRQVYEAEKATKELAVKLLAQAKAGTNFVELVKKYSQAPSREKDGDMGFLTPEQLGEAEAKALAGMKVGEFAGPFQRDARVTIYQ
ncbi:peptidylprolyl isomerase, partial [Candidatus Sumerlaeota bacterium]|nr:peptidylprolyl isomerase [Candidatus Sumerlaeota bacterium]